MGARFTSRRRRRPCEHCLRRRRTLIAFTVLPAVIGGSLSAAALQSDGGSAAAFIKQPTVAVAKPVATRDIIKASLPGADSAGMLPSQVFARVAQHVNHHQHTAHQAAVIAQHTVEPPPTATTTPAAPAVSTSSPTNTPTSPTSTTSSSPPSQSPRGSQGAQVLNKALSMEGVPYVYGGDSPSGFDCSGLVYWAALQIGVSSMPRDTYEMLAQGVSSGLLTPVSTPSYGDLAFFGSGHVEFYVKPGETFGAQQPGTTVGYHSYNGYYEPTEYYAIN